MFPYRRNGGKKRGKGGPGPRHPRDGRRVPGSAAELLPMLQPTTKALAQMLAGNTKMSGQLVHARNVLSQAQRLVEERAVERMPPAQREEFLEQLARLKLTLADADEAGILPDTQAMSEARPSVAVAPDRLRDVARRLAMSESAAPPPAPEAAASADEAPEEVEEPVAEHTAAAAAPGGRGERLRLRMSGTAEAGPPIRVRDRLRLRPLKPALGSSGE